MEKFDNLVTSHLEDRPLDPERLSEILASVLDRRQDRAERNREHIAELNGAPPKLTPAYGGFTAPSRLASLTSTTRR